MLDTENGTPQSMAKLLDEGLSTDDQTAWQAGTPTDWANESLALTIEYVYPLPESYEISEEYVQRAMPILRRRLVQAGVRLAWLLNAALKKRLQPLAVDPARKAVASCGKFGCASGYLLEPCLAYARADETPSPGGLLVAGTSFCYHFATGLS
jgi:hypothetical protein